MSTKPLSFKVKVGLIAFGTLVSLALLEICTRVFLEPPQGTEFATIADLRRAMLSPEVAAGTPSTGGDQYESGNLRGLVTPHLDDKIIFDLLPGLDITFQRANVKTNSCGMRSPERPLAKPPHTFRIALLGDSFAFGWGVEQKQSFPQVLEDILNRASNGKPRFEVLNFGVPGYSTFQEVAKFEENGLDFDPDAVLVFFIENDFGFPFYVRDVYNPGAILSAVHFARLTWQAIDPKIEEEKLRLTSYDPNRALARLADICKARALPLFFTINPKKGWKKHKRRLWVLKERRDDIRDIDMREGFEEIMNRDKIEEAALTLSFDPHPSPLRHGMYGALLAPHFMEFIE